MEKTLVLLKTDAIQRGIAGEILHRFERAGLKIVGLKLVRASKKLAEGHYHHDNKIFLSYGERTLTDCEKFGLDVEANMGTKDPIEIGKKVWSWNVEFLTSGPILALVLEGPHAVENVRQLVGPTVPLAASPGTIRGDFSLDSAIFANAKGRAIYNLIHASGTVEEADREIAHWFKKEEIVAYRRTHEDLYKY